MNWGLISACFGSAFVLVALGMFPLLRVLRHKAIFDHPNERSSHEIPTPRGAGLLLVPVIAAIWAFIAIYYGHTARGSEAIGVAVAAVLLCGFSWLDDLRGLPALSRLLAHATAATATLWLQPTGTLVFQGLLSPLLDHTMTVVLWVWFINLFNFMDGIDGISGVQAISICTGTVAVIMASELDIIDIYYAVALAGAVAGLLFWNWHPARIFLGDAGSAPLGFMLGWLLLNLAGEGAWAAALIIPLYYLADATITLLKRLSRGEKIWLAHRQHFYQRAVQFGRSHSFVSIAVIWINAGLIGCALIASVYAPELGLMAGAALVGFFLMYLSREPST